MTQSIKTLIERLRNFLLRFVEPDFVYDQDNWESTYEWPSDSDLLTDDVDRGEVHEFQTLIHGPSRFAVRLDHSVEWFKSERAARRALKSREAQT